MQLSNASGQDLKRLLELFSVANLRAEWPDIKGTKEEICFTVAESKDYERISTFVQGHLNCCKQHVYAFTLPGSAALPEMVQGHGPVLNHGSRSLFVLRVRYDIVLRDPLEETTIEFLWPMQLEITEDKTHALLRLVVLEKGVTQYFDRPCYVPSRSIEEKDVLSQIDSWASGRVDLHKGIKTLWGNGFMDSSFAKLKKALSMASEIMDEELGIREHNPELYGQVADNTLLSALFALSEDKH